MRSLTPIECRVLGSLIEKESTTPEYYPLSLNALVNACNQKSSREPVMELSEADVRSALFELENLGLVRVLAEGRVSKFEHRAYDVFGLRRPEIAVLGLLLLRGPQTAAELRARAERLYAFDDTGAVTATLERMAQRPDAESTLVRQLPRQPGARESRWIHLLGADLDTRPSAEPSGPAEDAPANDLQRRIDEMERIVQDLNDRIAILESRSPQEQHAPPSDLK